MTAIASGNRCVIALVLLLVCLAASQVGPFQQNDHERGRVVKDTEETLSRPLAGEAPRRALQTISTATASTSVIGGCMDTSATDSMGMGCAFYDSNPSMCTGSMYDDADFTAATMCCMCSASSNSSTTVSTTMSGSSTATGSTTLSVKSTTSTSTTNSTNTTGNSTTNSTTNSTNTTGNSTTNPTTNSTNTTGNSTTNSTTNSTDTTGGCVDTSATDFLGRGCMFYDMDPTSCTTGMYDDADFTAATLCCACSTPGNSTGSSTGTTTSKSSIAATTTTTTENLATTKNAAAVGGVLAGAGKDTAFCQSDSDCNTASCTDSRTAQAMMYCDTVRGTCTQTVADSHCSQISPPGGRYAGMQTNTWCNGTNKMSYCGSAYMSTSCVDDPLGVFACNSSDDCTGLVGPGETLQCIDSKTDSPTTGCTTGNCRCRNSRAAMYEVCFAFITQAGNLSRCATNFDSVHYWYQICPRACNMCGINYPDWPTATITLWYHNDTTGCTSPRHGGHTFDPVRTGQCLPMPTDSRARLSLRWGGPYARIESCNSGHLTLRPCNYDCSMCDGTAQVYDQLECTTSSSFGDSVEFDFVCAADLPYEASETRVRVDVVIDPGAAGVGLCDSRGALATVARAVEDAAAEALFSRAAGTLLNVTVGECAATVARRRLATATAASTLTLMVFLTIPSELSQQVPLFIQRMTYYPVARLNAAIVTYSGSSFNAVSVGATSAAICADGLYLPGFSDAARIAATQLPVGLPLPVDCEPGYTDSFSSAEVTCTDTLWVASGTCMPVGATFLTGTPAALHRIEVVPSNTSDPMWTHSPPSLYEAALNNTACFKSQLGAFFYPPKELEVFDGGYGFVIMLTMQPEQSTLGEARAGHIHLQDPQVFTIIMTCMNGAGLYASYLQVHIPIPSVIDNYYDASVAPFYTPGPETYTWESCSCLSGTQKGKKCHMDITGKTVCVDDSRACQCADGDSSCKSCLIAYIVIAVVIFLLCCCCCWCCCRHFQVGPFKKVFKGHAIIEDGKVRMKVPYRIQEVQQQGHGHHLHEEHHEDPASNKTRVIWELNEDETRQWFNKLAQAGKDGNQGSGDGDDETPKSELREGAGVAEWDNEENKAKPEFVLVDVSFEGHAHREDGAEEARTSSGDAEATPKNTMDKGKSMQGFVSIAPQNLAYKLHKKVEFFSSTMGMWLPARILALESFGGASDAHMTYAVKVESTDQVRHGVSLDELRYRLEDGERVEVFLDERGSTPAMWQPGYISGFWDGAALFGYKLTLDKTAVFKEEFCGTVQAVRVRRRFDVGVQIDVYFGAEKGWLPGTVLSLEDPSSEETAADELYRIDPKISWQHTRKDAIQAVRKAASDAMKDSAAARRWMQKGSVAYVGDEWDAWRLVKVQVDTKRVAEEVDPPVSAPTGEQLETTGEQPSNAPATKHDNTKDAATPENTFVVPTFLLRRREISVPVRETV